MGKDYAKFTGEIAKGIKIGESSIELKLNIPLKAALPHLVFLSNNQGEKVNVFLGDPQVSFDFGNKDPMYDTWTGHKVTTDASGVVISAEKQEPQRDENQAEMFGPEQAEGGTPAGDDQAEREEQEQSDQTGPNEQPGDQNPDDPEGQGADDDIPEWMREVGNDPEVPDEGAEQPGDDSAPREMTFGEDESGGTDGDSDQESDASGTVEIDSKVLEQFILDNRPAFDDMPIDFPGLYEQRRNNTDITWRELARSVGLSYGQLTGKLNKYKERVKEQMAQATAV
jgi:hypothetical protein